MTNELEKDRSKRINKINEKLHLLNAEEGDQTIVRDIVKTLHNGGECDNTTLSKVLDLMIAYRRHVVDTLCSTLTATDPHFTATLLENLVNKIPDDGLIYINDTEAPSHVRQCVADVITGVYYDYYDLRHSLDEEVSSEKREDMDYKPTPMNTKEEVVEPLHYPVNFNDPTTPIATREARPLGVIMEELIAVLRPLADQASSAQEAKQEVRGKGLVDEVLERLGDAHKQNIRNMRRGPNGKYFIQFKTPACDLYRSLDIIDEDGYATALGFAVRNKLRGFD